MLGKILNVKNLGGDVEKVAETIRRGVPTAVFNAPFSVKCHIAGSAEGGALYIVKDMCCLRPLWCRNYKIQCS